MKVELVSVVFVTLFLRANCDNDDEISAKLEAMEKSLAKMDAIEQNQQDIQKRLAALEQQQGEVFVTAKGYINLFL